MSEENSDKKTHIFAKGCLTEEKHTPLVAQIDKYAAIAGLGGGNMRYIWEPLQNLTEMETLVLKNIKKLGEKGKCGLLYVGGDPQKIADRLMALTGCMLRNYVDAQFMTLEKMLKEYADRESISAAVACIPNLHMVGTYLPPWQQSLLYDLLLQHMADGKLIIGYIENTTKMKSFYSPAVHDHLKSRFFTTGGNL